MIELDLTDEDVTKIIGDHKDYRKGNIRVIQQMLKDGICINANECKTRTMELEKVTEKEFNETIKCLMEYLETAFSNVDYSKIQKEDKIYLRKFCNFTPKLKIIQNKGLDKIKGKIRSSNDTKLHVRYEGMSYREYYKKKNGK